MALPRIPPTPPSVQDRNLSAWMSAVTDLLRSLAAAGSAVIPGLDSADANTVFAGPTGGAADVPDFRALVSDDVPNLDASKITSGTLAVARGGTGLSTWTAAGRLLYSTAATTLSTLAHSGSADSVLITTGASSIGWSTSLSLAGTLDVTGVTTVVDLQVNGAAYLSGGEIGAQFSWTGGATAFISLPVSHPNITNLDADLLDGQHGSYYQDASNLNAGTIPDGRFPATLPVVSGVNLTNLNASNLASGTVADARLSGNVALENTTNTFTANQAVTLGQNAMTTVTVTNTTDGTASGARVTLRSDDTAGANQRVFQLTAHAESYSSIAAFAGAAVMLGNNMPKMLFAASRESGATDDEQIRFLLGSGVDTMFAVFRLGTTNRRIASFFSASPTDTSGDQVIYIENAVAAPSSNPSGGGVLYVESGALKYRGSGGTTTTIAAA